MHLVSKHPPPLLIINSFIRNIAQFRGQTIQQIYQKNHVNTECTSEDEFRTRQAQTLYINSTVHTLRVACGIQRPEEVP